MRFDILALCVLNGLIEGSFVYGGKVDVYKRQALHKGAVLERVRELEGGGLTVGFGDSWFDVPMLRTCDTAWSLKGCELEGTDWGFPIRYSLSLIHIYCG